MPNDTAVFHASAYDSAIGDYKWVGTGTRYAIMRRNLKITSEVFWCPKAWLVDGWRDRP